jgi:hypothetical protein
MARSLSARAVSAIAVVTATLFAVARTWRLGGAGAFVLAGDVFTDPAQVPGHIPVRPGYGFDGQFFYRLASSPTATGMGRVDGIVFDYKVRGGRIGYPGLVWMTSLGGRPGLLAVAMIVVNVVAVGALAWVAARLAADHGRAAVWGLAVAGYWGFAIVLGRDLAELVAAAAVFGAVLLVGRRRYLWASVPAALAVLTREQCVLAVAAVAVGVLVAERRRGRWRVAITAVGSLVALPVAVFLVWQLLVASVVGELPATSTSVNTTYPFADFARSLRGWVRMFGDGLGSAHHFSIGASLPLLGFVALVGLVGLAVTSDGMRLAWQERPWEPLLVLAGIGVFACSSWIVLNDPFDFRQSYELAGASWLVLWAAPARRRRWALTLVVPVTVLAFAFRCAYA